ncbi:unnamed protein product [Arctogadus glacialis]
MLEVLIENLCAGKFVIQLGDEDCILPSKLQAALQQVLEEGELILGQEAEQEGASPGVSSKGPVVCLPGSCQPGSCLFLAFACGSALCLLPDFSSEVFGLDPSQCLAVQYQTGDSLDISGVVSGREGSRESGHTASLHMQQHSLKTEAQWSSSAAGYSQQAVFHWRELEGWMSLDLQAVFHWRELEGWMSLDRQAVFHWRELEGWMSLDLQAVFHWRELEGWMSLDLQAVFHWRELEGWMSLDLQAVFHWRELEGWMSLDLQAVFHWRDLEGWMSLDLQAVFKQTVHPYCYTTALSPLSFYCI